MFKQAQVPFKGPTSEIVKNHSGRVIARANYKYNKKNQLILAQFTSNGKADGRNSFEYSNKGIKAERLFNSAGTEVETINYEVNARGHITGYKVLNQGGKEELRWSFSYNKGHLQSGSRYIGKGLTEHFYYKNDQESGNKQQVLLTGKNEQVGIIYHQYKGGLLRARLIADETGSKRITYKYDNRGRLTEMKFYIRTKAGMKLVKTHKLEYTMMKQAKVGLKS